MVSVESGPDEQPASERKAPRIEAAGSLRQRFRVIVLVS
jgi:hypothetical protein